VAERILSKGTGQRAGQGAAKGTGQSAAKGTGQGAGQGAAAQVCQARPRLCSRLGGQGADSAGSAGTF
jgi:hypothetical protein